MTALKQRGVLDSLANLRKGDAIDVCRNELLEELKLHSTNLRRQLGFFDRCHQDFRGHTATLAGINRLAALSELRRVEAQIARIVLRFGDRNA